MEVDNDCSADWKTEKEFESNVWKRKLETLKTKADQIERNNLKIINRIYHVKKYIRQNQRIKRLLMKRLDKHNDSYQDYDTYFDIDVLKEVKISNKPLRLTEKTTKKPKSSNSHSIVKHEKTSIEKDPNAPKKPVNAFILYCQQKRTEYLHENPSIAHHDLSKLLAKSWNMLRMEDKQIYYDMYERDKERYEHELEKYTEQLHTRELKEIHSVSISDKADCASTMESSSRFGCQSQFISNRDPRISAVISPTLSDSSGLSFPLASIPSPTMTSQEEDSFAISNIPSPGF